MLSKICVFLFSAGPQITYAPKDTKVSESSIVSFFCKASGNPPPEFRWERDGKVLNSQRKRYNIIKMPHGSVLRIEPVSKKKDDAVFTCLAKNENGEKRANATLHVYPMNSK